MRKRSMHIPKGMTKDLSASKFASEYYYDALNIRLTPSDSNTLMSITNVKSNKKVQLQFLDIEGTDITETEKWKYIGHVVLNQYVTVFAKGRDADYIYRIDTDDYSVLLLAQGDFGFSAEKPIEGIGIYEKEDVQKVYWVDGINQPRVINIVSGDSAIKDSTWMDFIRVMKFNETIDIKRNDTTIGFITAGTIQYAFTYYNVYGQESNIFYQSPLYYISYNSRGASPDDTSISTSFTINIKDLDTTFDYVRIYSIHRSSTDAVPDCRRVIDLPTSDGSIIFVDDGSKGDTIDPTLLLYVGGREIIPYTMDHKDGTLFMGNYREKGSIIPDYLKESIRGTSITYEANKPLDINKENSLHSFYNYQHQLIGNSQQITTYKYGETYRFGVQLQKPTGEWSEPIFIDDVENDVHISTALDNETASLVGAKKIISSQSYSEYYLDCFYESNRIPWITAAVEAGYVRIRPLVVFPSLVDRTVICQGVLNPTVFNVGDRATNSPFAQASWFFRPNYKTFNHDTGKSSSPPVEFLIFVGTLELYTVLLPSQGTEILFRRSYMDSITGNMTYETIGSPLDYYGYFYMNYGQESLPVLVLKGMSTPNTNVENKWHYYFAINNGGEEGTVIAELDRFEEPRTAEYRDLNIWNDNLPKGLRAIGSNGLIWDSSSSYIWSSAICTRQRTVGNKVYSKTWTGLPTPSGDSDEVTVAGTLTQFVHYQHLPYNDKRNAEVQCNYHDKEISINLVNTESGSDKDYSKIAYVDKFQDMFFVDQSIVTLNSPEIDFDNSLQSIDDSTLKLRIVGYVPITATISDVDLSTSTTQLNYYNTPNIPRGFWHEYVGQAVEPGCYSLNTAAMWFDEAYKAFYGSDDTSAANTGSKTYGFAVYPWHRSGSLNNQPSETLEEDEIKGHPKEYRSAMLKTKKMSNFRFSANTLYDIKNPWYAGDVAIGMVNSDIVSNTRINGQVSYTDKTINYYGNIDKVLTSGRSYQKDGSTDTIMGYPICAANSSFTGTLEGQYHNAFAYWGLSKICDGFEDVTLDWVNQYGHDPVHMKYKSNPHAVICFRGTSDSLITIPRFDDGDNTVNLDNMDFSTPFWTDSVGTVVQDTLETPENFNYGYLWLGELYNENHPEGTRFGGQSNDAIESNTWLPAGDAVSLVDDNGEPVQAVILNWTEGDTYYQRYDCLKTYPFTLEDTNSVVDICSFMVETRVNIDGRYDRNRGQFSNLTMTPQNFNLLNPGYTQNNNFFSYNILDQDMFTGDYYPNYVTWSKTKVPGEKVDTWTNVTLANVLDMDGDKGSVQAIRRFNNNLYCFQDRGISQILYNENVQISSTEGVPIEIANSGKVQGKRYLTETVGCQNKWSLATSPYGLYFIDANNKTINRLSQNLEDLTNRFGFDSWAEKNISLGVWNADRTNPGVYRTFYDGNCRDVMFVGNHDSNDCLMYSETMNQFTSFYSWSKAMDIFSVNDKLLAFEDSDLLSMYEQYAGDDYCKFFGTRYPFSVTYIDAQDPTEDKIYSNIEFRSTVEEEGNYESDTGKFTPSLPFDTLESWNEYQHGIAALQNKNGSAAMQHHLRDNTAALKRKFRLWRCDIPRDNAPLSSDDGLGIYRFRTRPLDRMRNPWVYLKLIKEKEGSDKRVEMHDFIVDYFL